jgi:hypothetical protein
VADRMAELKMFFLRKKTDYYDRMLRMIDGNDLEFQGHTQDRHVNCIGTAITTAWSNLSTKVNPLSWSTSKTIGNGGARALTRKCCSKAIANVTLCEMSHPIRIVTL